MILKKVEVPLVGRSQCVDGLRTTRLGRRFVLHESFRCAGGEEGRDACTVSCYKKTEPEQKLLKVFGDILLIL